MIEFLYDGCDFGIVIYCGEVVFLVLVWEEVEEFVFGDGVVELCGVVVVFVVFEWEVVVLFIVCVVVCEWVWMVEGVEIVVDVVCVLMCDDVVYGVG